MDRNWFRRSQQEQPKEEPDEEKAPEPESAAPQYVTMEQFSNLTGQLSQLTTMLGNQGGQSGTSPDPEPPKRELPPIEEPSEAEIEAAFTKAVESGEPSDYRALRALENKRSSAQMERYKRATDERLETLQTQGMGMFGQINTRQARDFLKGQKYYSYVEKDVEERLKGIDASQLTPEVAKHVYDMAVGANFEDIQTKEAERQARERSKTPVPEGTGQSGRTQNREARGTFASVFGEGVASPLAQWPTGGALWQKNHDSPDRFAKNLGYNDADHYARVSSWIMQTEQCNDCFMDVLPNEEHNCQVHSSNRLINFPAELA